MNRLANLALSVGETLVHESGRLLFGIALGRAKELLGTPEPLGTRQLALNRALQKKAVDGALLAGPRTGKEFAKFTLKKGLPTDQQPKTLAIENEPHTVDDFDGVIKDGYGKGGKRLIYSGTGVIKVGSSRQPGKINIHEHKAEKQASIMTLLPKELSLTWNPLRSISPMASLRDAMPSGKPSTRTGIWLFA
jgi:hypothetical protein